MPFGVIVCSINFWRPFIRRQSFGDKTNGVPMSVQIKSIGNDQMAHLLQYILAKELQVVNTMF